MDEAPRRPDAFPSGDRETRAFCFACRTDVPAAVTMRGGALYLRADCPACGTRETLVEHDAALFASWEGRRRPNRPPEQAQTSVRRGCPHDCGLCPRHRQKSCIALVEITTACDLACPVCYADARPPGRHRPLAEVERMLDACVASANGKPEIVQISGGEPSCHPQLLEVLAAARARPFKCVMLNTNGLAIADGRVPAARLALLGPGLEVHLQFDGLTDEVYRTLRGRPLLAAKRAALEALAAAGVPVTLVATLRHGLNLPQAGDLLRFALAHPAVRGINFQCEAFFGRTPTPPPERVTQTEVVRTLAATAGELLSAEDFLPLSCGLACMAYLEQRDDRWRPIPPILGTLIQGNPLTATLEEIRREAAGICACRGAELLRELAARLPADLPQRPPAARSRFVQENFFHLSVIGFLDAGNFDLSRACRECTHIVQPDGRKIPFSAFNALHRGGAAAPSPP
jgi:uncharacterized radical SAM superfamily Fe-S cluster-containing enzyme